MRRSTVGSSTSLTRRVASWPNTRRRRSWRGGMRSPTFIQRSRHSSQNDWVAYNVRHQGTHQGEFEGVAPTGKHVEFRTMVFNRFADGIVVENWGLHDHASVLEQLRAD